MNDLQTEQQATQLTYVAQDLLRVNKKLGTIVHQINCVGAVGGLNRAICDKFTSVRQDIQPASEGSLLELGTVIITELDYYRIASVASQVYPGEGDRIESDSYAKRAEALTQALIQLAAKGQDLYVPYMLACGLAGDSWVANIEPILKHIVEHCGVSVFVCVPMWAEASATSRGFLKPIPTEAQEAYAEGSSKYSDTLADLA